MNKGFISLTVFLVMLFCLAAPAEADEYHYTNLIVGDRATGMGGAYTAISDDATGLYYNPAGITYAAGRQFSASVNAYYYNEKNYKGVIGGNGYTRRSSSLLPNFFGVVQPLGKFKVGISYAVPDSVTEDQQQAFTDLQLNPDIQPYNPGVTISSYTINFNNESNTYNFGPSIALEVADNFSTGLTLYYYQKNQHFISNQLIQTTNGGYEWDNQYYHSSEWGVRPVLGFMWSPVDAVSIGLAVSRIFVEGSDTNFMSTVRSENIQVSNNPLDADRRSLPASASGTSAKREYPTQVSLGVAWFASQSFLVTGDINYFTKVNEQDEVTTDGKYTFVFRHLAEPVTNIALGTEYYFTKNWALRAGLFTDKSNTENVESGGINQAEHIDLYGGTFSISNFTRNTSVTLGVGMADGTGKAQILGGNSRIQDVTSKSWTIFLSSSYSY
jgi:long-subunit fatty acid transport protein